MQGFWSSFDCIAGWKRKWIYFAFLASMAGMLWETNDLIRENPNHPVISPGASLMNLGYDEYGDPYARVEPAKSLPFSKIWNGPVTQIGLAFIIALVISSLFRNLVRGSFALVAVVTLTALLVGKGAVIDFFAGQDVSRFAEPISQWFGNQIGGVKDALWDSLPSACAAATGLVMGLMK